MKLTINVGSTDNAGNLLLTTRRLRNEAKNEE